MFGSNIQHGWEDTHLWWSLIERPQRSKFTRVQRLTCCFTLLFSFMALRSVESISHILKSSFVKLSKKLSLDI